MLYRSVRQITLWFSLFVLVSGSVLFITVPVQATGQDMVSKQMLQGDASATPTTPVPREMMDPFLQSDLQIISGNVQRPNGITWHDGFLYTSCAGDFTIYRIDDTTGVTITYVAGIQNTHSLYIDEGPVIWTADFQRNAVVKLDTSETPTSVELAADLASPWGIAAYKDEGFFVTQLRTDEIINITREGDIQVIASGFRNPTGIVSDEEWVYVANNGSARRAIEWFEYDPDAAMLEETDMQPLISGLQNTTNLIMGPDDLLYFAYSLGTRGIVGRIDPEMCREQGGCTNVDVEIVLWSELAAPLAGLSISDDMRLFVHTMFGAEIYWVQLPDTVNGTEEDTDGNSSETSP